MYAQAQADRNLKSLTVIPELSLLLASFLAPSDSFNLLQTCKGVLPCSSDNDSDNEESSPHSRFMHVSLRQSLLSIITQRPEFSSIDVASFIRGIGNISEQNDNGDQVVIAGSLIVQAITNKGVGASANKSFRANDIDIFSTAKTLPSMRQLLVDFGFVLTGVATTYSTLRSNKIHHVESYSLASNQNHITTVANGIRTKNLRRGREFLVNKESPYAMNPDFPFSKELRKKHIDLVVSSAATVNDTIWHFDIEMCQASFNGAKFFIPNLGRILENETRLKCPKITALVNSYASLLPSFPRCPLFLPFPALSRSERRYINFLWQCFQSIQAQGDIYFPDWNGILRPPSDAPVLSAIYVAKLHNMLVKIGQRVMKYRRRGFDFPDVNINEFRRKRERENTADDPTAAEGAEPVPRSAEGEALCVGAKPKHHSRRTDLVKRVKLLHRNDISSPVFRAKMRLLDKNGVNTTPCYEIM